MECLLDILRSTGVAEDARAIDVSEWRSAIELAKQHHVLPWVVAKVLESEYPRPPLEIEARFREAQRDATVAGFLRGAELKGLLGEFAGASLPVLALKGPWFAHRVYGSSALRTSRDLDLLVRREHFRAAEGLLQRIGFAPHARADDYHRRWQRGEIVVELHFDVENPLAFDFDIEGAWKRAGQSVFEGQPVWTLAPADELLYLCLHGAHHRFDRLSLILDIALALGSLDSVLTGTGKQFSLDALVHNRRRHLRPLLELGCALALRLRPDCVPPACAPITVSSHTDQLAWRLWNQLLDSPGEQRLDWAALHRFYLELETTRGRRLNRRLRDLRILAGRTIQEDYDFAAQFGIRRQWMVWGIRQLRLGVRASKLSTKHG